MKIKDKKQLIKLISYIVMGDGGLYITKNSRNAKFMMNMVEDNRDYVEFCSEVLGNLTRTSIKDRPDYNTDGYKRRPQVRLESGNHPALTKIRDRVYTGKYKGIDPHALKLLDWEALAILYMCDGSFVTDHPCEKKGLISPSYNVTLNMKRLSYGDLFILKKALKEKLDLEWNINRQGKYHYLRLRTKDVDKFMAGVAPFIFPSFQRKLKKDFRVVSPE